jgi:hypothetical protein
LIGKGLSKGEIFLLPVAKGGGGGILRAFFKGAKVQPLIVMRLFFHHGEREFAIIWNSGMKRRA